MKKIIIYAKGQVFEKYKELIDWKNIVAIADKKESKIKVINNVPVVQPNNLAGFEYDFIAIFSNKFFESIKRELIGRYFIPVEKIISWKEVVREEDRPRHEIAQCLKEYFRECNCKKVLDVGMNIIPHSILSVEELLSNPNTSIDGVKGKDGTINNCLYRKVYTNLKKVCKHYDAVILSDRMACKDIEFLKERTDVMLSHFPLLEVGNEYFIANFDAKVWTLHQMPTVEGVLWIARRNKVFVEKDTAIYVVTHKANGVNADDLYKPICVGNYTNDEYVSEKAGKNISYLNSKINECTALYWIWKNTSHEYVGLNHYRRYFYNTSMKNTGNYLDKETICNLLENYDIILPVTHPMPVNRREIDRLRTTMDIRAFEAGYNLIRNSITKNQPNYVQAFDDVMNSHNIFVCNMFVTKREILNAYCEWLFSFLIEAAEAVDVSGYDSYSQRVIGFFAERMWTVWLRRQNLKIKEMPYDEL